MRTWVKLTDNGGYNNLKASNYDDVYEVSPDSKVHRISTQSSFPARHAPCLWDWNGRLILGAGNTNTGTSTQCDVWELREA